MHEVGLDLQMFSVARTVLEHRKVFFPSPATRDEIKLPCQGKLAAQEISAGQALAEANPLFRRTVSCRRLSWPKGTGYLRCAGLTAYSSPGDSLRGIILSCPRQETTLEALMPDACEPSY